MKTIFKKVLCIVLLLSTFAAATACDINLNTNGNNDSSNSGNNTSNDSNNTSNNNNITVEEVF